MSIELLFQYSSNGIAGTLRFAIRLASWVSAIVSEPAVPRLATNCTFRDSADVAFVLY